MSNSVRLLVASARDQIRNLSVAEVAAALESGGVTLVDLREADEVRREGAIPSRNSATPTWPTWTAG
jgi:rhodanese-related sulfurtransferase